MTTQAPAPYQALAAYARLSRNPDGSLTSVPDQERIMRKLADREGYTVTAWFSDDDESAWDTDNQRPGWQAYLAALGSGAHDGALSYHLDRLSRNGPDSEAMVTVCRKRKLDLITPGQVFSLGSNDDHVLMFRMWSAVAAHQSDSTARRVKDHKDEAREAGRLRYVLGGPPPTGFTDGPQDWLADPAASAMLTDVAKRVLAGQPLSAACAAQPQVTDARGRVITERQVRAALKRPVTAGFMTDRDGNLMPEAVTTCCRDGNSPPLAQDLWHALQPTFTARRQQGDHPDAAYPLGKVLACGECGNQLSGGPIYYRRKDATGRARAVKVTPSYQCKNPHRQPDGSYNRPCRGVSISAEAVDEVLGLAVEAWAQTSERWAQAAANQAGLSERAADLHAQQAHQRKVMGRMTRNLADGLISDQDYDAAEATVRATLRQLEDSLADVQAAIARPLPVSIDWASLAGDRKRTFVAEAFVTPIAVVPAFGSGSYLAAVDRMSLTPRP